MSKSPDAFRTIREVADMLDIPQHVLRFWEGKFPQVKPLKRAGGRRYYRPEDVDLLRGIRALLYAEGYTIKGVQKVLREGGPRRVCDVGRIGTRKAGLAPMPAVDAPAAQLVQAAEAAKPDPECLSPVGPHVPPERVTLEAALAELLALRDLLRRARAKADAA